MNISLESCERSRPPQLSTAFFYAYMQLDKTWTLSLQSKTPATLVFLAATTCNKVGAWELVSTQGYHTYCVLITWAIQTQPLQLFA